MLQLFEFEDVDFLIKSGVDTGVAPTNGLAVVEYYVNQERVSREDFLAMLAARDAAVRSERLNNSDFWIGVYHGVMKTL